MFHHDSLLRYSTEDRIFDKNLKTKQLGDLVRKYYTGWHGKTYGLKAKAQWGKWRQ